MTKDQGPTINLELAQPRDAEQLIAFMRRFYEPDHMDFREAMRAEASRSS